MPLASRSVQPEPAGIRVSSAGIAAVDPAGEAARSERGRGAVDAVEDAERLALGVGRALAAGDAAGGVDGQALAEPVGQRAAQVLDGAGGAPADRVAEAAGGPV